MNIQFKGELPWKIGTGKRMRISKIGAEGGPEKERMEEYEVKDLQELGGRRETLSRNPSEIDELVADFAALARVR